MYICQISFHMSIWCGLNKYFIQSYNMVQTFKVQLAWIGFRRHLVACINLLLLRVLSLTTAETGIFNLQWEWKDMEMTSWVFTRHVFSYLWNGVCSILSGAGKFCLAHGLRQLSRDAKLDVSILYFRSDVTFAPTHKISNDVRKSSLWYVKC